MANSIRLERAEKDLSAKELHDGRKHKLVTIALIAAGTLAMLLILYYANQPEHEPSAMPHDLVPHEVRATHPN